jgi:quercetin dioxygenase-like cupin family protein
MNTKLLPGTAVIVLSALSVGAIVWGALPHTDKQSAVGWLDDICTTVSGPMFSSAPAIPGSTARPSTKLTPLACESLPNVPGKSMTTAMVDYPPMAYTPAHRHPGSVTAVVIEGTIKSQVAGGPPIVYKAGQTWFEAPGALHMFAENPDPSHPAKLLATFITDENCGPLVLPP